MGRGSSDRQMLIPPRASAPRGDERRIQRALGLLTELRGAHWPERVEIWPAGGSDLLSAVDRFAVLERASLGGRERLRFYDALELALERYLDLITEDTLFIDLFDLDRGDDYAEIDIVDAAQVLTPIASPTLTREGLLPRARTALGVIGLATPSRAHLQGLQRVMFISQSPSRLPGAPLVLDTSYASRPNIAAASLMMLAVSPNVFAACFDLAAPGGPRRLTLEMTVTAPCDGASVSCTRRFI